LAFLDTARTSPKFSDLWCKAAEAVVQDRARSDGRRSVSRYRHLLALRFALVNMAALALVFIAATQGWVETVLFGDETGLTQAIVGVFIVGWAAAVWRVREISSALNAAEEPAHSTLPWIRAYVAQAAARDAGARAIAASSLKMQLAGRIAFVK